MNALAVHVERFEGAPLARYTFRGKETWLAGDVGRVLGYGRDGAHLANVIRKDWADEMIREHDFASLTGDRLHEFKLVAGLSDERSLCRARHLLILYETGLDFVCLKTDKPLGRKLRRFLVEHILPKLRRGELSSPPALLAAGGGATAEQVRLTVKQELAPVLEALEAVRGRSDASLAELVELSMSLDRLNEHPVTTGAGPYCTSTGDQRALVLADMRTVFREEWGRVVATFRQSRTVEAEEPVLSRAERAEARAELLSRRFKHPIPVPTDGTPRRFYEAVKALPEFAARVSLHHVAGVLACAADDLGRLTMSIPSIANGAHIAELTAQQAIDHLVRTGWVEKVGFERVAGLGGRVRVYRLAFERL